jgi:hypothetical protein
MLLTAPDGVITGFGLVNPKLYSEREAMLLLLTVPQNRPAPGTLDICDKGFAGHDFEHALLHDYGITVLRPAHKDEPAHDFPNWLRQRIESVNWTLRTWPPLVRSPRTARARCCGHRSCGSSRSCRRTDTARSREAQRPRPAAGRGRAGRRRQRPAGSMPPPVNISVETFGLLFDSDAVTVGGCDSPGDQVGHQLWPCALQGGEVGDARAKGVLAVVGRSAGG